MKQVLQYRQQYEKALAAGELPQGTSFADGIVLTVFQQGYKAQVEQTITTKVGQAYEQKCLELQGQGVPDESLPTLEQFMADPAVQEMIAQAKAAAMAPEAVQTAYQAFRGTSEGQNAIAQAQAASDAYDEFESKQPILNTVNGKIREVNRLISGLTNPTAVVVNDLAELCDSMDDTGVASELTALARMCRDLLKTLEEHEGEGASLLEHTDDLGDLAGRVTVTAGELLERVDELTGVVNTYEQSLQSAVTDIQTLSGSAQSTLHDLAASLTAVEGLLRTTGPQLDEGTRNTLDGVSTSLRKATAGLGEIDTVRNAKDTIKTLVDDEWDSHSGEVVGLLNIDAGATPVSMTDSRNPAPGSIQYVMRTQEIKVEEKAEEPTGQAEEEPVSFWGRVAAMFRGIWESFKKLLHIG